MHYLSIKEVIYLHERTILNHGGKEGVRDMGLLSSALLRPQSGYYNSLSEQAAALLQSLCMNHCFVDGNKRIALLASVVFIKMNGYNFKASNSEFVTFIIDQVITSKVDLDIITNFFEKHLIKK